MKESHILLQTGCQVSEGKAHLRVWKWHVPERCASSAAMDPTLKKNPCGESVGSRRKVANQWEWCVLRFLKLRSL